MKGKSIQMGLRVCSNNWDQSEINQIKEIKEPNNTHKYLCLIRWELLNTVICSSSFRALFKTKINIIGGYTMFSMAVWNCHQSTGQQLTKINKILNYSEH